jgi:drug/metabolite transporter (DMT)-like permease
MPMSPNLRGMLLMTLAMAAFAVEDAMIKLAAGSLPPGQILLLLGIGGALFFGAVARRSGASLLHPAVRSRLFLLRNACEVAGTLGFVTALALIPISTASAILQAAPIVVTAGAALFLGERVGWRRWTAVAVGFLGVLLILRPADPAFDPNALWAVLGVVGLAGRDLVTRRMPAGLATSVVAAWAFAAVGALGAAMLGFGLATGAAPPVWPGRAAALALLAAFLVGLLAYWMLVEATRAGDVAAITPLRYSRMVFALAIGILVFGERPDAATLAGTALIIGSGLYAFARERARARAALASAARAG